MTDAINLAGAFAAGILLGSLFFGGLWWTARKGLAADSPALWFLGSVLLRTSAMMVGFHLVAGGDWRRALACLFGFMAARLTALRLSRAWLPQPAAAREVHRES